MLIDNEESERPGFWRQLRLPGLREGLGVLDDRLSELGITS